MPQAMNHKVPLFVTCNFPLDTTVPHFRNWLMRFIVGMDCTVVHNDWIYRLGEEVTETQSEDAIDLFFPGTVVTDPSPYLSFLGIDEETFLKRPSQKVVIPFFSFSLTPLAVNRIEVVAQCSGGVFNDCFRRFLLQVDTYWPTIKHLRCDLTYGFPPLGEHDEDTVTIADFLLIPSRVPAIAGEKLIEDEGHTHQLEDKQANPPAEQSQSASSKNLITGQPGRPAVKKPQTHEGREEYFYRLCIAQRIQELRGQDTNMTWLEIDRLVGWSRNTRKSHKTMARTVELLASASPSDLAELQRRRQKLNNQCQDGQKPRTTNSQK
ncbi:MAG: hypothetical protein WAU31_04645 [Candidatus Moraniibacteriota bacterium]